MTLYTAHKILISFAIVLGLVLLIYGVTQYRQTGSALALATGVVAVILDVGFVLYLRWFLKKQPPPPGPGC